MHLYHFVTNYNQVNAVEGDETVAEMLKRAHNYQVSAISCVHFASKRAGVGACVNAHMNTWLMVTGHL
jgi:hypothetical protein